MELLYVWIEDYNNIHHQGFNFSPKHRFHFEPTKDEDGKVTGGTLTHDDINPNYPDSFFGEHISNITAIVGRNGSGKSSLVNCIKESNSYTLIVFEQNANIKYWTNYSNIHISSETVQIEKESVSTNYFNHIVYYSPFINSNRNSLNQINRVGDISNIERLASALRDVDFTPIDGKLKALGQNANSILTVFCEQEMTTQIEFVKNSQCEDLWGFELPQDIQLTIPFYEDYLRNFDELNESAQPTAPTEEIDFRFYLFLLFDILNRNVNGEKILGCAFTYSSKEEEVLEYLRELSTIRGYNNEEIIQFAKSLVGHELTSNVLHNVIAFTFNSDEIAQLNIFSTKDPESFFWIPKKWVWDLGLRLTWRNLSDGEATLLSLFARLWEKVKAANIPSIVLLDEFELGLHPQWQKEAISRLILFFSSLDIHGYHLIITTHSPILLSDLPRENIIFLDKNTEGKCEVKELQDMERTFGANIHNLYRSSFFMQDGLMGKFAKEKIDGVIRDLRGSGEITEERKEEMHYIIDMVGEPIIRNQLRKMYNEKFHLYGSLDERIAKLECELAELKNMKG